MYELLKGHVARTGEAKYIQKFIIIIYLSWSWATCWPVPVSLIQKSRQSSAMCLVSFSETCQWLKFPPNGLRAQSRAGLVVGLLLSAPVTSYLGMALPPFLVKQLYRCDSFVISSFVRTAYTTRRWGWLLGRIGHSITHHYSLYPTQKLKSAIEELREHFGKISNKKYGYFNRF
jgi:hypothetical protein